MSGGDWKDMFGAAIRGDIELVRFHLDQGIDPNYAHPEYMETPLVATVLAEQVEVAHLLLQRGADPALVSPMDGIDAFQAARLRGLSDLERVLKG